MESDSNMSPFLDVMVTKIKREPKYQCTPVSEHIRNCAKNKSPNFSVFPFFIYGIIIDNARL